MRLGDREVDVEQVLATLDIELGPVLNDNYVTRCPWPENHSSGDAHASFAVSAVSGAWICYVGCGSGSLLTLVQRLRGVDESEARRWVFTMAVNPTYEWEASMPTREALVEQVGETEAIAQADYSLMDSSLTSSYFLDRGFTMQTIRSWGIKYDKWIRAIVLPVYDCHGSRLVGVIRRMVPPLWSGVPKYLYTPGFERKRHLFAAQRHPRNGEPTIVVEGPLDALWLHQHGYTTAVALMGSYLGSGQLAVLRQLGGSVVLALDSDDSGRAAVERLEEVLRRQFVVQEAVVVGGKDVQELDAAQLAEVFGRQRFTWSVPGLEGFTYL